MYNSIMKRIIIAIILIFGTGSLFAVDSISLEIQMISPDTTDNNELIRNLLISSAARSSRIYDKYISVKMKKIQSPPADYKLELMAVLEEENPVMVLTFTRISSGEALSQTLMGEVTSKSVIYLSEVIFKLWADMNHEKISYNQSLPEFIEEIPSRYIIEAGSPGFSGYNTASAVAVKDNGNLILGMGSYCFELDSSFNVISQLGGDLINQTSGIFIFGISVTPGGTVYMKPTNGREVFKSIDGVSRTQRIRAGIEVNGPMAVLNNGVMVLYNIVNRKFVRVDGTRRANLDLGLGPYTYINAMAAGPEGNLWIFDPIEQRMKIYSDDGTFINSLMPVGLKGEMITPMSMAVYDNGAFLLYYNGKLYKFDPEGILLWQIDGYQFREYESFPATPINLAVDSDRGLIYMADYAASRLLKFYEPDHGNSDINQKEIMTLNKSIDSNPESLEPIWDKVNYYYEEQAWVLTKMWLEEIVNLNPFDDRANEMLLEIELNSLLGQVELLKLETFDIIKKLGPESAREQFSRTVQLYEKILSLNPGNSTVIRDLNRFKDTYNRESAIPGTQQKPLTIASVKIENIFPSLIHYYQDNPIGKVTIRNDLDVEVSSIRAELNLRQFIDYPQESEIISSLAPGQEVVIDLKILLNDKAFNIEEDLPVLAQVNVMYEIEGILQNSVKTTGATLYRRTALSWDNTAKLAAFIMPNEGIVSAFSHRVLDVELDNTGLPDKMVKAARICDALGTYGITYVEDPDSPFSLIMGKEQHVDTVRYPRTTLNIQSGDCDDTTALLTSLLESSGIATSIMTSPGHVFLAFDTEEPIANKWMFETEDFTIIEHSGTVWIPVESTVLSEGFFEAWRNASSIINSNKPGEIDFVPVKNQRATFPPLPLSESNLIVVEPNREQIAPLFEQSIDSLIGSLYDSSVENLNLEINRSSNRRKRQLNNKLAILHGRFQNFDVAENIFQKLIKENANYISPYMNLGNLYYYRKDFERALDIFEEAKNLKPDSAMLNLALAKTYHKLNDSENTVRFFNIVQSQSESLSDRFAYLINEKGTARAGIEDEPPISWDIEEE